MTSMLCNSDPTMNDCGMDSTMANIAKIDSEIIIAS